MMDNRLQEKLTESFTPPEQRKAQLEKEGEEFWQRRLNKFERCGKETIDFINALDPTLVLDLGAGDNQYKPHIKNLIGIDLVNDRADIKADISALPYDSETVDAAICFGSINFGDEALIETQLKEMYRVLKPNGYAIFRGNMRDHEDSRNIYYGWSEELVHYWTEKLNLTLTSGPEIVTRTNKWGKKRLDWVDKVALKTNSEQRSPYRLFWIWKK